MGFDAVFLRNWVARSQCASLVGESIVWLGFRNELADAFSPWSLRPTKKNFILELLPSYYIPFLQVKQVLPTLYPIYVRRGDCTNLKIRRSACKLTWTPCYQRKNKVKLVIPFGVSTPLQVKNYHLVVLNFEITIFMWLCQYVPYTKLRSLRLRHTTSFHLLLAIRS